MDRRDAPLVDVQWVAHCARRLRERWPHADPTSLEEAARELWTDEGWRALAPAEAAARWLAPIGAAGPAASSTIVASPIGVEAWKRSRD